MKILMVCLGNICRSPMADGILGKRIQDLNLNWEVDSAGTAAYHIGEAPDERMRKTGLENNTPIDHLTARQFKVSDFDAFDIIFAMDKSNRNNILKLARNQKDKDKVRLMLNESNPGLDLEVPDPYHGGEQGFKDVFNMLEEAINAFIEKNNG